MNIEKIWTTELKNETFGGLIPKQDPFDKTKFYLSDGWGSAYPSMKLRRLSFRDGKELNTAAIKNSVRCMYFNSDEKNIFAASDNKLFQINRADLSIVKKFEKGIQKYNDFISSNNKDTLLLMNFNGEFLFIYNYLTEKGIKKKVKSCKGIFQQNENTFLIFSPKTGSIQHYDLFTNKLKVILKTEPFFDLYKGKLNKFYLHLGKLIAATETTHERVQPINQINIYSNFKLETEIKFDFKFEKFVISENEQKLYLIYKNQIWIYSFLEKKIIKEIELNEKVRVAQVFDEQQVFISYEYDKSNTITCWKLNL